MTTELKLIIKIKGKVYFNCRCHLNKHPPGLDCAVDPVRHHKRHLSIGSLCFTPNFQKMITLLHVAKQTELPFIYLADEVVKVKRNVQIFVYLPRTTSVADC